MSDPLRSIGQTLREARESQGLSVEEVATRLRLMQRQVDAIESDDFASLGQPVFARGFVRNYAKLLELPHDALLARMAGDSSDTRVVTQPPSPPPHSWLSSPWLILLMLGLVVAVAVPMGLYLWLNSDSGEGEAQTMPVSPAVTRANPAVSPPAADSAAEPAAPPALSAEPPKAVAAVAAAEQPAAAASPAEPSSPAGVLNFEFGAESWVEIRDGSGRMVHRQLNTPGSQVEVTGQPPFDLVVGNAAQVRMTYNGRPIDLDPFIEVTVARFSLEE
jgi:cytoskeleton protein RodZ